MALLSCAPLTPQASVEQIDLFQWHWWSALAILLFIAEILLPGFWLLCLGIGAAGGAIAAGLGGDAAVQILSFAAVSLVAFFTIRPILKRSFDRTPATRMNAEALSGRKARVTQDFDPSLRLGRVAVDGDDWRAECINDRSLRQGDIVEVIRVESNTLIVRPLDQA
jgi:membrane protein implicated in regulation of membrane protease activity